VRHQRRKSLGDWNAIRAKPERTVLTSFPFDMAADAEPACLDHSHCAAADQQEASCKVHTRSSPSFFV
jgi:hypothetical protein